MVSMCGRLDVLSRDLRSLLCYLLSIKSIFSENLDDRSNSVCGICSVDGARGVPCFVGIDIREFTHRISLSPIVMALWF